VVLKICNRINLNTICYIVTFCFTECILRLFYFIKQLISKNNDLQSIVEKKYPIIKKLLTDLKKEKGCYFSRMTGSGSVCYGLFIDQFFAKKALYKLKNKYPKFWFSLAKTV